MTGLLELETKQECNIEFVENCYRYVNHDARLATTGYQDEELLRKKTHMISFTDNSIKFMNRRYERIFGGKK